MKHDTKSTRCLTGVAHPTLGLTMIEVLAVVGILTILVAILFPVFARAKERAQEPVCASRLRQGGFALALYVEDHGDYPAATFPNVGSASGNKIIRRTSSLLPYVSGARQILVCPLDRPSGRTIPSYDHRLDRSYGQLWFLWEGTEGRDVWRRLLTLDPNPSLFRCAFHTPWVRKRLLEDEHEDLTGLYEHGSGLAVRRDGSIFRDMKVHYFPISGGEDMKRTVWSLATPTVCPEEICDEKSPAEGVREW